MKTDITQAINLSNIIKEINETYFSQKDNHSGITCALHDHLEAHAPNIFFAKMFYRFCGLYGSKNWEADLIKIDTDGCLTEYEIKTTYNDFVNDFKKSTGSASVPLSAHGSNSKPFIFKYKEVLNGRRCNKFYYVVSEKIYDKIHKKTKGLFGFIVYTQNKTGGIKFITKTKSKVLSTGNHIPQDLYHVLAWLYRANNPRDLNLSGMNDEQIILKCLIGRNTYNPRLRKQRGDNENR